MNKFFERRRNEFHATCDDIPVFQLGAVVFRHGFVAQGDGWDSNRSSDMLETGSTTADGFRQAGHLGVSQRMSEQERA